MPGRGLVIDVSSVPPRPAGAGRYAIELVSNLRKITKGFDLISKSGDVEFWEDIAAESVILRAPNSKPLRVLWEQEILARKLNRRGERIYHGIHYTIPGAYRGFRVSTVHDLTMIEHPEWHERVKVNYFSRAIRYAVENADAIVVPSRFTKSRLESLFGALEKVHVVYHGVDHLRFKPMEGDLGEKPVCPVPGLSHQDRVVLHIGTIEPRKNIENLVKAFEIVAGGDPSVHLVLVGQKGWQSGPVFDLIGRSKHRERIHVIGYLSDTDLLTMLYGSSCVVYPSFAEGFGLPVLEAMAAGIPIVTSAGSVMEEVAGDCAWLCDPRDPISISGQILEAISRSDDSRLRVANGIARSDQFNWLDTARKHLEIYNKLGLGLES